MQFTIGAAISASMMATSILAAGVMPAAADTVPKLDVEPSCSAAARQANVADYVAICRETESKARDELARQWPQLDQVDKTQCIPAPTAGGKATYTELLTCIELTRDVRQLRRKAEPTTTGQRSK